MDIEANVQQYLQGIGPLERYASFDFCFNYFQAFAERNATSEIAARQNLQTSCLHLGFYLASWGMLRGSSFLLSKSVKFFESVISAVARADPILWKIDANVYSESNVDALLNCRDVLVRALGKENGPSDILVSKIMLGVFGNVPAFDTYFRNGLGVSSFGRRSLAKIARFYLDNHDFVDRQRMTTLDFDTGQPTHRLYTRAKVIDMIFFIEGSKAKKG